MKRILSLLLMAVSLLAVSAAPPSKNPVIELQAGQALPDFTPGKALVIDFNASWCMPCRMFRPAFERAAKDFSAKADFVSVNIDDFPEIAQAYNVRSIPYIVILRQDAEPVVHLGAMTYDQFADLLEQSL